MKSTDISDGARAAPGQPAGCDDGPVTRLPWHDIAAAWPLLAPRVRRALAASAGRRLHALWVGRDDLRRLPPVLWQAECSVAGWRVHPPDQRRVQLPFRLSTHQALEAMGEWHEATFDWVSRRDQAAFLRAFFKGELADRAAIRFACAELARAARVSSARHAAALYGDHLRQRRIGTSAAGWWTDPAVAPDDLRRAVEAAAAGADMLKEGSRSRVFRATLMGREVVVKQFEQAGGGRQLKDLFRASRARRAWAAAATLRDLGLPTPEPLGYLDIGEGRAPATTYFVTAHLPGAVSVREWVRRGYGALAPAERQAFRGRMAAALLGLYRRGVYHADTKTLNMLVTHDGAGAQRLWWIDLDAARPGHIANRHEILRNLVQLNGSVRSWIPDEDRLAFLRDLAWDYPWLMQRDVPRRLRAWTERRLRKEIRTRCGP